MAELKPRYVAPEEINNGQEYGQQAVKASDFTKIAEAALYAADVAKTGAVLEEDIVLAGNYVSVGNISKGSATATTTYPAKGKTVTQLLTEIFSKVEQPSIVKQPSVTGFSFSRKGNSVEVGTTVTNIFVGTLSLDKGAYTYDTDTGVSATGYKISRVLNGTATQVSTETSYTDEQSFTVSDGFELTYNGEITYSQGNIAKDNMGNDSDPPVRISAGTASSGSLSPLTGYRNYFYGTTSNANPPQGTGITSAFVRGLTKSNAAYSAKTFTLNVPAGATGVYIACLGTKTGVTKVINETALNADVTATFTKQTGIMVEGASGYTAVSYNIWHYIPAVPYENAATLKVTLG